MLTDKDEDQTTLHRIYQGAFLTTAEIATLKKRLSKSQDDVSDRVLLIAHYTLSNALQNDPIVESERIEHILWILKNCPAHNIGQSSLQLMNFSRSKYPAAFEEATLLLLGHIRSNPDRAEIAYSAARFFNVEDPVNALKCALLAYRANPHNRDISEFIGDLYHRKGISKWILRDPSAVRCAIEYYERALQSSEDLRGKIRLLVRLADLYLIIGEPDEALSRIHDIHKFRISTEDAALCGNAIHAAAIVHGLICLSGNNFESAKNCLKEATEIIKKSNLKAVVIPDLRLAQQLLTKNERDSVVWYLLTLQNRYSWINAQDCIEKIEAGYVPDLRAWFMKQGKGKDQQ